ncbi:DNA methyltransferase [Brevundimonas sp. BH3]|uniref:DNA methyltransferase n=1 Tax=Brevundimonas sp. BH3 TaxID=3133089 RepID=UPI003252B4B5
MSYTVDRLNQFVAYALTLDGDEKGEAQVFCDRLFKAFGHEGYKEAGAVLEYRIKKASSKGTSFADLIWKPRVLIEMKRRGEKLHLHLNQAFQYWLNAVPNRPRYVVLCNFDEFWIYDFDRQLDEPVDIVRVEELSKRYTALNFLFADNQEPLFGNDREEVSRGAAKLTAELFRRLIGRSPKKAIPRDQAQRFVLQLVIAMFAEDIDLIPSGMVSAIVRDCLEHKQSSYDLFGGLFAQMNNPVPATGGRYAGVPYFNGGLFSKIDPVELNEGDLELIGGETGVAKKDWSKVNPAIFGTLFQQSMDASVQHQHGRHYTSEADILRVVGPTIVAPWRERIDSAPTMKELLKLRKELQAFRVLDPACGSGNFLYVAFRELARLDIRIMTRLQERFSAKEFARQVKTLNVIRPKQFFGLDNDPFGVELAKVTLMLAKKLVYDEALKAFSTDEEGGKGNEELDFGDDPTLPLDNMDQNIRLADALFDEWPAADAIVGNPPFQSKNKIQGELSPAYLRKLRLAYPDIDGRADFCVYWLRRANAVLKDGQRAGFVATNTIRQNYSRESGLDHIVASGTITEAVSSMIWPGTAVVHVSIVNWVKGSESGLKRLYNQDGNDPATGWRYTDLDRLPASLSFAHDVTKARKIDVNARKGGCYQGQTHGHKGFLLEKSSAKAIIRDDKSYAKILRPFLTSDDLVGRKGGKPSRYVIDFSGLDMLQAKAFEKVFPRIQTMVLPDRQKAAQRETDRNKEVLKDAPATKVNLHHANFLSKWWRMSYERADMMKELRKRPRYIACGRVTKRPIFEFVSSNINPNDALTVFAHDDDYSFGILQSDVHWEWFTERCSTMKSDPRYTSNTVFDTFPWPQSPSAEAVAGVAKAARNLRAGRRDLCDEHDMTFRELYRTLELPGSHPLKDLHAKLDKAVRVAYGMPKKGSGLPFILKLNDELAAAEAKGLKVQGPGVPAGLSGTIKVKSSDCISEP